MSTIPLFQGEESVEDLCLLIKSLHEEMSTMHRKVDVLLAIKTDNTEALREMVASGPALAVVPNEDEATPVVEEAAPVLTQSKYDEMSWADRLDRLAKAKCPQCDRRAYSKEVVEAEFGYRTMEDGKVIVQSWCRECRALEQATSPRKKTRLPDDVRELGVRARDLHKQADAKAAQRTKVLEVSKGRPTKESVTLLCDEQDLRTQAVRLLAEYDQKRGIIRKARNTTK